MPPEIITNDRKNRKPYALWLGENCIKINWKEVETDYTRRGRRAAFLITFSPEDFSFVLILLPFLHIKELVPYPRILPLLFF